MSTIDVKLGFVGRGQSPIGRKYEIQSVWIRRYIKGECQENLDSLDAVKDSSHEESSTDGF